jgi:hypothetical protein
VPGLAGGSVSSSTNCCSVAQLLNCVLLFAFLPASLHSLRAATSMLTNNNCSAAP